MPFSQASKASKDSELDWSLFSPCSSETPGKPYHQEKVSVAVNWNHVKIQQKEEDEIPNPKHLNLSLQLLLLTTKSQREIHATRRKQRSIYDCLGPWRILVDSAGTHGRLRFLELRVRGRIRKRGRFFLSLGQSWFNQNAQVLWDLGDSIWRYAPVQLTVTTGEKDLKGLQAKWRIKMASHSFKKEQLQPRLVYLTQWVTMTHKCVGWALGVEGR